MSYKQDQPPAYGSGGPQQPQAAYQGGYPGQQQQWDPNQPPPQDRGYYQPQQNMGYYQPPPQGYPPQQGAYYQQGGYPQQGYYQQPQQQSSSGRDGCLGALVGALACCCCLDILF